jgi:hypothetical protein
MPMSCKYENRRRAIRTIIKSLYSVGALIILEFATANGCDYILFDNDAPVINRLPTFEK